MSTFDTGRAEARSRANRRLRNLTVGTTLAAVAATGGLSWLAALTHSGAASAVAADVVRAGGSASSTTTGTVTTARTSRGGATSGTTIVTQAQGAAHATTGGS